MFLHLLKPPRLLASAATLVTITGKNIFFSTLLDFLGWINNETDIRQVKGKN